MRRLMVIDVEISELEEREGRGGERDREQLPERGAGHHSREKIKKVKKKKRKCEQKKKTNLFFF